LTTALAELQTTSMVPGHAELNVRATAIERALATESATPLWLNEPGGEEHLLIVGRKCEPGEPSPRCVIALHRPAAFVAAASFDSEKTAHPLFTIPLRPLLVVQAAAKPPRGFAYATSSTHLPLSGPAALRPEPS
jgi:hypothetical protein